MSFHTDIVAQIEAVAREQGKTLRPLHDELPLLDSGLDSLCFAILVTRLEDHFGFDPFTSSEDQQFPVTLGEFVSFYENAAQPGPAGLAG